MNNSKSILVFGEIGDGDELKPISSQVLNAGRILAEELSGEVILIIVGADLRTSGKAGIFLGADRVLIVENPLFKNYLPEAYLNLMTEIVGEHKPLIVLFGHTNIGLDLAPRLAFRLRSNITLDCVDVRIDSKTKTIVRVKPIYGGKAYVEFISPDSKLQIISIRDRAFENSTVDKMRTGTVLRVETHLDTSKFRTSFIGKERDNSLLESAKLDAARVVVSGGRGIGSKEGFDVLRQTARNLNGHIAGSRGAIDEGWLPRTLQVGLTGKIIAPEIYFVVGISGALQHIVGCLKSKRIIAINNDSKAPIFRFADYGVIGDYRSVLSAFNSEIAKLDG